jgi:tol-pal system protein YbgF
MRARHGLFLAAVLALAPGCFWFTTKDEGNKLGSRVGSLEDRMTKNEQALGEKLTQLDESLEKATKLLTRNSADIGAEVEKLGIEMGTLTGEIEDLKRQVTALRAQVQGLKEENAALRADFDKRLADYEQRIAFLEKKAGIKRGPGGEVTEELDKDALYKRAQASLAAGQLSDARKDFREFVKRFPQEPRAADAQLAIATTFVKEKAYDKALGEFQRVIDAYPDSEAVDDALWGAGQAAEALKWCLDARAYYGLLVQKFPKSPHAKDAQKKLEYLKKNAKKKDVCQS